MTQKLMALVLGSNTMKFIITYENSQKTYQTIEVIDFIFANSEYLANLPISSHRKEGSKIILTNEPNKYDVVSFLVKELKSFKIGSPHNLDLFGLEFTIVRCE